MVDLPCNLPNYGKNCGFHSRCLKKNFSRKYYAVFGEEKQNSISDLSEKKKKCSVLTEEAKHLLFDSVQDEGAHSKISISVNNPLADIKYQMLPKGNRNSIHNN